VTDGPACPALVWRTHAIGDDASVQDWASLSEPDVARTASFTNPAALTRFVATRALLRAAVVQLRPDLTHTTVAFAVTPTGRLEVVGHPDLAVSSSHTRAFAAAAVAADGPVGIDVEPLSRGPLPRPAAWLTPSELDDLAHLEARAAHEQDLHRLMLLHLWVAKEAALKAWPGPGSTTRKRIRILCEQERRGETTAAEPAPADASWCGAGAAVVEPADPPPDPARRPQRAAAVPAALRLDIGWYAVDDAYLVALAHRHQATGAATSRR
jgi:phosphopantetheinyl transferase